MRSQLSFVLSQITRLTDKRTDGQTEFSSLDRVCMPCSAVNKLHISGSLMTVISTYVFRTKHATNRHRWTNYEGSHTFSQNLVKFGAHMTEIRIWVKTLLGRSLPARSHARHQMSLNQTAIFHMLVQNLGVPSLYNVRPKPAYFWVVLWHHDLSANVFRMKRAKDRQEVFFSYVIGSLCTFPQNLVKFGQHLLHVTFTLTACHVEQPLDCNCPNISS